ncbi:prepilin peptidase [Clostridium polyendosporum]|uniref:Prepilin peptidase n=1 Tax=Clostridium polyendosporum TaxID=69208 RepID=A0A919VFS4_9CLOT|nr:A24 family peptidase [Clostridium polyendosporum]GIM28472.1 prepilin peptidase [Clostridium polyendosporum]
MSLLIVMFGLLIGSFLNVCIYRIPRGESIAYPQSHCPECLNDIRWYDLIPIISYTFLRGKCRYCGEKISFKYPLIELLTGGIFLVIYIKFGITFNLIKYLIMASFLIVIAIIDFETTDVFSITTYSGIAIGILLSIVGLFLNGDSLVDELLGAGIGVGIIALIVFLTKGMGEGDIEIAALCGIFLGWKGMIITLMISFILGAIVGILLIVFKIKGKQDAISFGPYLAIGALISLLLKSDIINFYLLLFFTK